MCKRIFATIPAFLMLVVASSLLAQQTPPPAGDGPGRRGTEGPPPVLGTITSVGVDRFEIKNADGTTQTVMVNDQTHYRQRQPGQEPQQLQLEDLKAGDHVFVRGASNADKQLVAAGVSRVSEETFQRFQSGGGPGGPGGPGGGGWGRGGPGGGAMEGTRTGGQIVSINGNQINVHGHRGDLTIVVNDQTTFSKDGQTIALKDLKVGDHIFAMGKEANGQFVATQVHSGFPAGGRRHWQQPQN